MATKTGTAREMALAGLLHRAIPDVIAGHQAVMANGDARAVHDLRTALRRVRSLLRLLQREAQSPLLAGLRGTAHDMAAVLAPVRAWDVFLSETLPLAERHGLDAMASARLANAAQEPRTAALHAARDTLRQTPMQDFANRLSVLATPHAARIEPHTANAILGELYRRTLQRGRHLRSLDDEARHRLRLAGKALADTATLIASEQLIRRRALRQLKRLTTTIGNARDRAMARTLASQFADPHTGAALHRALDNAARGQERRLRQLWRAFRHAAKPRLRRKQAKE